MSNGFSYLKQNCPVCDGARKDCRRNCETGIIHCRDTQTNPLGFQFIGEDSLGFYMWVEGNECPSYDDLERRKKEQESRHKEQLKQLLPVQARDRQFRIIARHLGLSLSHRQKLQNRGLAPETIEWAYIQSLLWTWQNGISFFGVTSDLPGIENNGKLRKYPSGFAVAIPDNEGKILGCQIRQDTPGAAGGKYFWVSSEKVGGNSIHLPNGETPIGFYRPSCENPKAEINIAEGFLKSLIIAHRHDVICIGAAAANFAGSPEQFRIYLDAAAAELGTKLFVLNPDAAAVVNPHIFGQYRKAWKLAKNLGYTVKVRWWEQVDKSAGDADEISGDVFDNAQLLSVAEFEAIAREHLPKPPVSGNNYRNLTEQQALEQVESLDPAQLHQEEERKWREETEVIQQELSSLRVLPTIEGSGAYIPNGLLQLPSQPGIVLVSSTMNTGKTAVVLRDLTEAHRQRYPQSLRWLFTPRNLLGLQAGYKLGLPHHTLHTSLSNPFEGSGCLESIGAIVLERTPQLPPLIVFDEASQSFKQILEGNTCKEWQPFVIQQFRKLCRKVAELGGWIVLSEDGLSNIELDLIKDASGLDIVEYLKFTKVSQSRDYTLYDSVTLVWEELEIRLDRGENVVYASDSANDVKDFAAYIADRGYCGIAIHGDNSGESWVKELSTDPDTYIYRERPRYFAFTPSLVSGCSIDDPQGHFSAMGFKFVHLEPRQAKQMPDRLRTNVPRYGFIRQRVSSEDNLFSGSRPEAICRNLKRNAEGVQKLTQFAEYVVKQTEDVDILSLMYRLDEQRQDSATDFGFYLKYFSQYKACANYGKLNLRENLIEIWRRQGHNVQLVELGKNKVIAADRKIISAARELEEAIEMAAADTTALTVEDARIILDISSSLRPERVRAKKRLLENALPGCPLGNVDFVLKAIIQKNQQFLKNTKFLWLMQNPEFAKAIDRWTWFGAFNRAAKRDEIVIWHRLSIQSTQADLLNQCPLEPFISGQVKQWANTTPQAIAVKEWALFRAKQLKQYLRLIVKPEHSPIQVLNKLLKRLGFECKLARRQGARGVQIAWYHIINLNDVDRDQILKSLTERFKLDCKKHSEPTEGKPEAKQLSSHTSLENTLPDQFRQDIGIGDRVEVWQRSGRQLGQVTHLPNKEYGCYRVEADDGIAYSCTPSEIRLWKTEAA